MSAREEIRLDPAEIIDAAPPPELLTWFSALVDCVGYPFGYVYGICVVDLLVRKYTAAAAPPINKISSVPILPIPFLIVKRLRCFAHTG